MSEENEPETIRMAVTRIRDVVSMINLYQVSHPDSEVEVYLYYPANPTELDKKIVAGVLQPAFLRNMFLNHAINDLEHGEDPNAIQ